jgi:hypothetical protein
MKNMKRQKVFTMLVFSILFISAGFVSAAVDQPPVIFCADETPGILDSLQNQVSVEKSIQNSITSGNSQALSAFFFSTIELSIPEAQGSYSKTHAELLMKNFFSKYPVQSFTIINEGQSGGEKSRFAIGTYTSSKSDTFRVYYLTKEISGKNQLTILKFE